MNLQIENNKNKKIIKYEKNKKLLREKKMDCKSMKLWLNFIKITREKMNDIYLKMTQGTYTNWF